MKKIVIGFVISICAICLCVGMIACASNGPEGEYELVSVSVEGETYNVGDKISFDGLFGKEYEIRWNDISVSVNKMARGKVTATFTYQRRFGGGLLSAGGLWSETDGKIKFNFNGSESFEMKYEGNGGITFIEQMRTVKGVYSVTYELKRA